MFADRDFQLLEARTADVRVDMPWRRDRPYMNPHAVFSKTNLQKSSKQREHITAIIGKNGTGKSHLLGAIVQTFITLQELKDGKKRSVKELPLDYLEYLCDGRRCTVKRDPFEKGQVEARVEGRRVMVLDLPLPRRVLALTISPFDKFPVPRRNRNPFAPPESSMYQYLGLRDSFGKASIQTLLYRSLNSLFEKNEDDALRNSNIGAVFEFLNLKPTVNVIYRLRSTERLREAVNRQLHLDEDKVLSSTQQRQVEDMERSGVSEFELRELLDLAYSRANRAKIEIRADFEYGGEIDDFFHKLQPLRRAGFLNLIGVEVTHKSGLPSDLRSASSGTLSMVSALIALASVIKNGSLILIDEPELSLHPEWQIKYVDLLVRTFSRYTGCHFVVATHSPMVISELPVHADVISLENDTLPPTHEMQGKSADFLLAEAFGLPTNNNLYIKNRIVDALRLVAEGKAKSDQFSEVLEDLQRLEGGLEEGDPSKTIIENLQQVADQAGTKIRK
jgi:predicted ATPase